MSLEQYAPWITLIGSALGSIIAVATLISRRLGKQDDEIKRMWDAHYEEKRLRTIHETQFDMFWQYWKQEVPKVLMKPHTPEIDAFLKKMQEQSGNLSREDATELVKVLEEILDANYDVYTVDYDRGTYLALLIRFRTELDLPEKVEKINKEYQEEKEKLEYEYELKKKRRFKFW